MKISIKNFGPIFSFDFDLLKDFNIIFGKNNIGKSYAITAIYLIIKNLTSENFTRNSFEMDFFFYRRHNENKEEIMKKSPFFKLVDDYEKDIIKKTKNKDDEINITNEIEELFKRIITQTIIENLEKSFINSFSSIENLSNRYSKQPLTIELFYKDFQFSISCNNNNLIISNLKFYKPIFLKDSNSNRQPKTFDDKIVMYLNKKNGKIDIFDDLLSKLYFDFKNEVISLINNIYFLPASRSGLYQALSTFSAVIAELSKSRNFLSNRIELPNISEPVSDYFLYLSNISTKTNKTFSEIVANIEKEILKGQILFNKDTKKIFFSPTNLDMELDLAFTSSMISEIAPIVAYLKYIINSKDDSRHFFFGKEPKQEDRYNLIFIEEPEAHLHPEIQVKLLEIFGKLLNLKIKIIITSHSNYMFNKLSNLILDNQINFERVGSYLMKTTDLGSVIDSISMKADEDGIKDENFANIAETLYEERINIYDKLNLKNS
jgi:predicted ATPase